MHICHVNLASGYSGGESQTLLLIKQQIKEGYELTVVANPKSPFAEKVRQLDCKLVLSSHFLKAHNAQVTQNCSAIHVHEGRSIYWALIQSKLHKVPYIITRRIDIPLKNKLFANLAYANASALVGLSKKIVELLTLRHPAQQIVMIPDSPVSYPIDSEGVNKIRARFANKTIVIQAANLLFHKGHETTLETAKLLQDTHPDIEIVLLGTGPQEIKLKSIVKSDQIRNVTFAGKQFNMGDWFEAADFLIHPSYTEGLGSVILEAIKAELPVIGTRAGGIPDIIENEVTGLLVEPKDEQALAAAIVRLHSDSQLRNRLIEGGNDKLKFFDISYTSQQYRDLYKKLQQ